jgi:hypothetical protein
VNNAIQNEACIWDTSLNAEEDEKELVFKYTFFIQKERFLFLFPIINRLIIPAAAAIIAEHAETNSSSSALLKRSQLFGFPDQVNHVINVCDLFATWSRTSLR